MLKAQASAICNKVDSVFEAKWTVSTILVSGRYFRKLGSQRRRDCPIYDLVHLFQGSPHLMIILSHQDRDLAVFGALAHKMLGGKGAKLKSYYLLIGRSLFLGDSGDHVVTFL
jgi:hypothetical protein